MSIWPGPELHEGEIAQLREMALEVPDHPPDDARIVVRILEEGGDGRPAPEQQAIVAGQPEVRIDQLGIPALHLLARREQDSSSLSVSGSVTLKNVCAWKTSSASGLIESLQLVDRDDDVVRGHAARVRVGRVIFESLHLGALEDLHAVVDQQSLNPCRQRSGLIP